MKVLKSFVALLLIVSLLWSRSWLPEPVAHADAANDVSLTLTTNKPDVDSGETFTYQINFSFSALTSFDFANTQIVLPLPAGLNYVNTIIPNNSALDGTVVLDDPSAPTKLTFNFKPAGPKAGDSYSVQVNVRYPAYVTPEGTHTTTAVQMGQSTGTPGVIVPFKTSNDVTVTSHASADWTLTKAKILPVPTPLLGDNVQYEIFFNNNKSNTQQGVLDLDQVVIQDQLPPGSQFVAASDAGAYDSSSHSVVWTTYNLHDDKRYYVTVNYPTSAFTDTDTVVNKVTADFNPIGTDRITGVIHRDADVPHGFTADPIDTGFGGITKRVEYRDSEISPGQQVKFYIWGISNNANTALDNVSLTDLTPVSSTYNISGTSKPLETIHGSAFNLKSIRTAAFNDAGPTYQVLYTTDNATWQLLKAVHSDTPETIVFADLSPAVAPTGIKFVFDNGGTNKVPVTFRQTSNFELIYDLDSSYVVDPNHETIVNTAGYDYTFNGKTVETMHKDISDHFLVTPSRPLVKLDKSLVSTGPFKPEDTIEFKINVENSDHTSATFHDPVVIDLLPEEFELVENSWSYSTTGINGSGALKLDVPDTGVVNFNADKDTLLRWKFDAPVDVPMNKSFTITYKAKIKKYTKAGQLTNTARVTSLSDLYINDYYFDPMKKDTDNEVGDAAQRMLITSKAYLNVNKVVQLTSVKQVRGELDDEHVNSGWQIGDVDHLANTVAGGRVDYKLTVRNESNIDVKNIVVIDALPRIGDQGVIVNTARDTTWNTVLTAPVPDVNNTYKVEYSTDAHPKMEGSTWSAAAPADLTTVTGLKFIFNSGYTMAPGASLDIIWTMKAPVGTPEEKIAWNSFGYKATENDGSTAILAAEPPKVGVHIAADTGASLGNYVWVDLNGNGIQDEDPKWGVNGVRVDLLESDGITPVTKFGLPVFTLTGNDTNGNPGYYLFPTLTAGTYKVKFSMPSAQPGEYTANHFASWTTAGAGTSETDSDVTGTGDQTTALITLPAATADLSWDAGLVAPLGSIGDYVWLDENGDGIQNEAASKGLNNVSVELLKETSLGVWTSQGTQLTADKGGNPGYYQFTNLLPGTYKVRFPKANGTNLLTKKSMGSDRALDSNANTIYSTAHGDTDPITLRLGEIIDTIDAGYVPPASLGDQVWLDTNDNGIQDAGEPGISVPVGSDLAGLTVQLMDNSGNPIKKEGVNVTTTISNVGLYVFDQLLPGTYKVKFTAPSGYGFARPNQGGTATRDSDANRTTGLTGSYTLAPGDSNLTADAGLVKLVKLGDFVWNDKNQNGIQDAGEPGISGVTVKLYDTEKATPALVTTTTTDSSGNYLFTGLYPGRYKVEVVRPAGYLYTSMSQGTDDAVDSDFHVPGSPTLTNAMTDELTLISDKLTIDAGLVELASVGDFVWRDLNDNGIQDAGESGVAGIKVRLLDSHGVPVPTDAYGTVLAEFTTLADGKYLFSNLLPGSYQIKFTLPTGYWFAKLQQGTDRSKDSDAQAQTDLSIGLASVTLATGDHNLSIDAGILSLASIGDFVWHDLNGNGIQDTGEDGVTGVKVELLNADGTPVLKDAYLNNLAPAITDNTGHYKFENLLPGDYRVKFSNLPAGFSFTAQGKGTAATGSDATASGTDTGLTQVITLGMGQQYLDLDAGIVNLASLGDKVWSDKNNNGLQDSGEPGVAGVKVQLYAAADLTTPLAETLTDANGLYAFTNLWPGQYVVKFLLPSNQYVFTSRYAGSDTTADSNADPAAGSGFGSSESITLVSGTNNTTIDAGLVELASIGDFVWVDDNDDGIQSPGESGHAGVIVHLLDAAGNPVMNGASPVTATTDSSGKYLFDKLLPGTYHIQFELPAGYRFSIKQATGSTPQNDSDADQVSGTTAAITLNPGVHHLDADAGIVKLTALGDYVWMDRNLNGIQDAGEPGVAGVTVRLLDALGNPVLNNGTAVTTLTDSTGHYLFDQLQPGSYRVAFDLPPGYVFTQFGSGTAATGSDADPAAGGRTAAVTLTSGQINLDLDAGLIKLVSLGDTVWVDTGIIGQQDGEAADPAAAGITVHLLNANGSPVLNGTTPVTALTDANGHYLFTNLYPGDYKIRFELPSGYIFTSKKLTGNGFTSANDSDADANGLTSVITLVAGEDELTIDAGIVLPASLGDYVWEDVSANGIQDATEKGKNGVTVELHDAGGTLLATTVTASKGGLPGYYEFTNLIPGSYQVTFKAPDGYMFTAKHATPDTAKDSDAGLEGRSDLILLAPGQHERDIDAGLTLIPAIAFSGIGNYVWIDVNANGLQDSTEHGLNGVTVELYNRFGALISTQVTKNDDQGQPGYYLFQGLIPDRYTVQFKLPSGYQFTYPKQGNDKERDSNADAKGNTGEISLQPGVIDRSIDAGLIPLSSLGDFVWVDTNNNGKQDPGEPGLNGVQVTLYDEDGREVASQITGNNASGEPGYYEFKDLTSRVYRVAFKLPDGYEFVKTHAGGTSAENDSDAGPDGRTGLISLPPGTHDRTIDAGLKKKVKPEEPGKDNGDPDGSQNGGSNGGATPDPGNHGSSGGHPKDNGGGSKGSGSKGSAGKGQGSSGSAGKGHGSSGGAGQLPKTGETAPLYPYIGYGLIAASLILFGIRLRLRKRKPSRTL